jgi:hypothetical protein
MTNETKQKPKTRFVALPLEIDDRVVQLAAEQRRSVSNMIMLLVEKGLDSDPTQSGGIE